MSPQRIAASAGFWGAALTLVILAMSVLLRLGTHIQAGEAISMLAPATEQWARIAHRVAAMGVGVAAAAALVGLAQWRAAPRASRAAVFAIVALTLVLSAIGRYTPGYRFDLVTVVNVAGGVALVAAFWWLREASLAPRSRGAAAWLALALLIALAGLGAAMDAAAMRGLHAHEPLHIVLGGLFLAAVCVAAWQGRARPGLAALAALLALGQLGLGAFVVSEGRPLAPAWLHAMLACAMAPLLVRLAWVAPRALDQPGLPSARALQ